MPDYWPSLTELLMASKRANVVLITKDNQYPGENDGFGAGLKQRWGVDDEFCWAEFDSNSERFETFDINQHSEFSEGKVPTS